jgi:hypothetical protein
MRTVFDYSISKNRDNLQSGNGWLQTSPIRCLLESVKGLSFVKYFAVCYCTAYLCTFKGHQ